MCGGHLLSKGKHVLGIKVSSPNLPLFPESIFFPDQPSFIISFLNRLPGVGRGIPGRAEFSEDTVSIPSQGEPHRQDLYSLLSAFIHRSLLYANIHSGHRVETEHQLP